MAGGIKSNDRHACAVEGDAVTQTDIVQVMRRCADLKAFAMIQRATQVVNGGDAPHAGDDSGEHARIFADQRTALSRTRKSGPKVVWSVNAQAAVAGSDCSSGKAAMAWPGPSN